MTTMWFTSDLHLGHKLVSGLRGFWQPQVDLISVPDTLAHDAELAKNWDAVVKSDTHRNERLSFNVQLGGAMVPQVHVGPDAWNLGPVNIDTIEGILTHAQRSSG